MAAGTPQTGSRSRLNINFLKARRQERQRNEKVAAFYAEILPMVDPDGPRHSDKKQAYQKNFDRMAQRFIDETMSAEDFERFTAADRIRFENWDSAKMNAAMA